MNPFFFTRLKITISLFFFFLQGQYFHWWLIKWITFIVWYTSMVHDWWNLGNAWIQERIIVTWGPQKSTACMAHQTLIIFYDFPKATRWGMKNFTNLLHPHLLLPIERFSGPLYIEHMIRIQKWDIIIIMIREREMERESEMMKNLIFCQRHDGGLEMMEVVGSLMGSFSIVPQIHASLSLPCHVFTLSLKSAWLELLQWSPKHDIGDRDCFCSGPPIHYSSSQLPLNHWNNFFTLFFYITLVGWWLLLAAEESWFRWYYEWDCLQALYKSIPPLHEREWELNKINWWHT